MSRQKNNISNKIQSDNINDDTSFEDTDEDNDVINEQNPILDFEIFEKMNKFKNCVCKLEISNDGKKKSGTGFFCYIPSKEIRILITNSHIINEKYLKDEKEIICIFKEKDKTIDKIINLESNRYKYSDNKFDATVVEILDGDFIDDYFEVDENLIKDKEFVNELVFNLQYTRGEKLKASFGKITKVRDESFRFEYDAGSDKGSSGSPIILENNLKVIGLHKAGKKSSNLSQKINVGIYLDKIIPFIPKQHHPENDNIIKCIYDIKNKDLNKDIKIYENKNYIQSKIQSVSILSEEEQKKRIQEGKYRFKKEGKYYVYFNFNNQPNNLSSMFYNCSSLSKIYIPSFPENKIMNMSNMFQGCTSLREINFLPSFNSQHVKNMSKMFLSCESLENINLSSLNTKNVKYMSNMFLRCQSLNEIDLSSFNTENVKDMSSMFSECIKLKKINLSSFNIKNVSDVSSMFENCNSLEKLDLSSFNDNNISTMRCMFRCCESLKEIDLSKLKVKDNTILDDMFNSCFSLKVIKCDDKKILNEYEQNKDEN